jgi:hypothetical protein
LSDEVATDTKLMTGATVSLDVAVVVAVDVPSVILNRRLVEAVLLEVSVALSAKR